MNDLLVLPLAAGVAAAAFSVLFGVRRGNILFAALAGWLGYFVFVAAGRLGALVTIVLASAAVALFAEVAARLKKTPATLFLVAGLIPIVPGGSIYQGVLQAIEGHAAAAALTLLDALMQTGAIAVGIILVSSLIQLVPRRRD